VCECDLITCDFSPLTFETGHLIKDEGSKPCLSEIRVLTDIIHGIHHQGDDL